MPNDELLNFLLRVFRVTSFDHCDDIWWRTDGEYAPVSIWVNCNDVFFWGSSDLEQITPENIDVFEQSYHDCREAGDRSAVYGGMLFCCRVRQMRPQGACYPKERELWPLFDACGPEREVGLGNPYKPGKAK